MNKKKLLYAILPIFIFTMLAAGTAYAATAKSAGNHGFDKIAAAIASKFNLKTADVQSVIDETMAAERAQMQKNRPERIDPLVQAVKDGKLTQAQADLITAKKTELKTSMTDFKNMTQTERTTMMKAQSDALKQWAADNKIPEQYIMPSGGHGNARGAGRMFGGQGLNGGKHLEAKTPVAN